MSSYGAELIQAAIEFHFVFSEEDIDGLKALIDKHTKISQLPKGVKSGMASFNASAPIFG